MSDTLESLRARIKELETQLAGAQQGALIGPLAQRLGIRSEAMEDFEGRYRHKFAAESDPPSDEG